MGIKGYSYNPSWQYSGAKGYRRVRANPDIAKRCIKQYKGKVMQDLKARITADGSWVRGNPPSSVDFVERPNDEVWVITHASWASHAYRIESEAARKRILDFMEYVENI